jgi:hypothetical protein
MASGQINWRDASESALEFGHPEDFRLVAKTASTNLLPKAEFYVPRPENGHFAPAWRCQKLCSITSSEEWN